MTRLALRFLTKTDIPWADSLRAIAGWNQTPADWERFVELSPQGCLAAEVEGRPVATATTVRYGSDIAWIGMILVHPDFRRRGIARILMEHCIELLRAAKVRSIKLDATPEGREVYLRLGFKDEFGITRFAREGGEAKNFETSTYASRITDLDQKAFGAGRGELLKRLADAGRLLAPSEDAFGLIRPGARADYIGPVAAPNLESAKDLIAQLASSADRSVYCDIPDYQTALQQWLCANGFAPQRKLTRMFMGENLRAPKPETYFAIAAPDLG